jgi:hypothetical protein
MRISFLISAFGATLLVGCGSGPRPVAKLGADIERVMPSGWSLSTSNDTVRIRSEHDVTLIGRISRPAATGGMEELAQTMGRTAKYEVTLSFVPLLSSVEFKQLRAARRPFEQVLENGAASKDAYTDAQIGYEQHSVPSFYNRDYSVFVDRPNDRFVEIYPPDAAARVESLMSSLKGLFHEY